jgi:hypothetical protein
MFLSRLFLALVVIVLLSACTGAITGTEPPLRRVNPVVTDESPPPPPTSGDRGGNLGGSGT